MELFILSHLWFNIQAVLFTLPIYWSARVNLVPHVMGTDNFSRSLWYKSKRDFSPIPQIYLQRRPLVYDGDVCTSSFGIFTCLGTLWWQCPGFRRISYFVVTSLLIPCVSFYCWEDLYCWYFLSRLADKTRDFSPNSIVYGVPYEATNETFLPGHEPALFHASSRQMDWFVLLSRWWLEVRWGKNLLDSLRNSTTV